MIHHKEHLWLFSGVSFPTLQPRIVGQNLNNVLCAAALFGFIFSGKSLAYTQVPTVVAFLPTTTHAHYCEKRNKKGGGVKDCNGSTSPSGIKTKCNAYFTHKASSSDVCNKTLWFHSESSFKQEKGWKATCHPNSSLHTHIATLKNKCTAFIKPFKRVQLSSRSTHFTLMNLSITWAVNGSLAKSVTSNHSTRRHVMPSFSHDTIVLIQHTNTRKQIFDK